MPHGRTASRRTSSAIAFALTALLAVLVSVAPATKSSAQAAYPTVTTLTISPPGGQVRGQPTVYSFTVTAPTAPAGTIPKGIVVLRYDAQCTEPFSGFEFFNLDATGHATHTVSYTGPFPPGGETVNYKACYYPNGNSAFLASQSATSTYRFFNELIPTVTTFTISPSGFVVPGQPIVFSFAVTAPTAPAGTVPDGVFEIRFDGQCGGPFSGGFETLDVDATGHGTYTKTYPGPFAPGGTTVSYTGCFYPNPGFLASQGATYNYQFLNPVPTVTNFTISPSGSQVAGQPIVFSFGVTAPTAPAGTVPTGIVELRADSQCGGPFSGSIKTLDLDATGHATYTVTYPGPFNPEGPIVRYTGCYYPNGNPRFLASQGATYTYNLFNNPFQTVTNLTISPPVFQVRGRPVVFSFAVTAPNAPAGTVPQGIVELRADSECGGPLAGIVQILDLDATGHVTYTRTFPGPFPPEGSTIKYTACYYPLGNAAFLASEEAAYYDLFNDPFPTVTTLTISPEGFQYAGSPVTGTVTVTAPTAPAETVPTGTVEVHTDGSCSGTRLASAQLVGGQATIVYPTTAPVTPDGLSSNLVACYLAGNGPLANSQSATVPYRLYNLKLPACPPAPLPCVSTMAKPGQVVTVPAGGGRVLLASALSEPTGGLDLAWLTTSPGTGVNVTYGAPSSVQRSRVRISVRRPAVPTNAAARSASAGIAADAIRIVLPDVGELFVQQQAGPQRERNAALVTEMVFIPSGTSRWKVKSIGKSSFRLTTRVCTESGQRRQSCGKDGKDDKDGKDKAGKDNPDDDDSAEGE